MTKEIITSVLLLQLSFITTVYLEANFVARNSERNNKVNKGVWTKNKYKDVYEKPNTGAFIFQDNSIDTEKDNSDFNIFKDDFVPSDPVTSYIQRNKRSIINRSKHFKKSISKCQNSIQCKNKKVIEDTTMIVKLKPVSLFIDSPDFSLLVKKNINNNNSDLSKYNRELKYENLRAVKNNKLEAPDTLIKKENIVKNNMSNMSKLISFPKRSIKAESIHKIMKKMDIIDKINKSDNNYYFSADNNYIYNKNFKNWSQNSVLPNMQTFEVIPKPNNKHQLVNQKSLIKVISIISKTFRKMVKQYNNIKNIQDNINNINDDLMEKIIFITNRFNKFETEYLNMLKIVDEIKEVKSRIDLKEEFLKNKDKSIAKSLIEFENQQKKFMKQQQNFFKIQKLILSKNEDINNKQMAIAKTQNEISIRQNNFARILKKTNHIYLDTKYKSIENKSTTTTNYPTSTESIKINLFSINSLKKIPNFDQLILKEKDDQSVDDIVYKYYFNNSFIENFMRNTIFKGFSKSAKNAEIARNIKNKRNKERRLKSTVSLPIMNDIGNFEILNRNRRWINMHSNRKLKRKNKGKEVEKYNVITIDDTKIPNTNIYVDNNMTIEKNIQKRSKKTKYDPFHNMAKIFCNEMKQNTNEQAFKWCIEKAIRKLKNIDIFAPTLSFQQIVSKNIQSRTTITKTTDLPTSLHRLPTIILDSPSSTLSTSPTPYMTTKFTDISEKPRTTVFFPDNDELEDNLKKFELKPDTEGNVYYESSLHSKPDSHSQDYSDFLPDINNNPHIDLNPELLDFHVRRRSRLYK